MQSRVRRVSIGRRRLPEPKDPGYAWRFRMFEFRSLILVFRLLVVKPWAWELFGHEEKWRRERLLGRADSVVALSRVQDQFQEAE